MMPFPLLPTLVLALVALSLPSSARPAPAGPGGSLLAKRAAISATKANSTKLSDKQIGKIQGLLDRYANGR